MVAHRGMNGMNYTTRRPNYWPDLVTDIFNTIKKCRTCTVNRLSLRYHPSPLEVFPSPEPLTDL